MVASQEHQKTSLKNYYYKMNFPHHHPTIYSQVQAHSKEMRLYKYIVTSII